MDKVNLGLSHIGLYVSDLEVSKKFYCEKLDFSLVHENTVERADGITKIAFVQAGSCVFELVQLPNDKERTDGLLDHIAFEVKDIDEAVKKLKAKGITFETEKITTFPHFFSNGSRWIMFRGPDNEHLELNEIL